MTPAPVARCQPSCSWRDASDHDEIASMQENGEALAEVLAQMVMYDSNNLDGRVGLFEISDFVRAHNWPNPLAARWLADNLEEIFAALHPQAEP